MPRSVRIARAVNVPVTIHVSNYAPSRKRPAAKRPATPTPARQLYAIMPRPLRRYVERSVPSGPAGADDIVQETFIRAWRHLPQLSSADFPVRPWLFRVARNLLIDADRAARSRPVTVPPQPAEEGRDDTGLDRVLDQQLVADALDQLSPAHRTVLVETFYRGRTLAKVARELGIPDSTARSRLHYALQALRRQLEDSEAIESP
jgi:RNA polymerase sigma-70 factor, ECF subfamily